MFERIYSLQKYCLYLKRNSQRLYLHKTAKAATYRCCFPDTRWWNFICFCPLSGQVGKGEEFQKHLKLVWICSWWIQLELLHHDLSGKTITPLFLWTIPPMMSNTKCNETAMYKKWNFINARIWLCARGATFHWIILLLAPTLTFSHLSVNGVYNNKRKEREKSDEQFALPLAPRRIVKVKLKFQAGVVVIHF